MRVKLRQIAGQVVDAARRRVPGAAAAQERREVNAPPGLGSSSVVGWLEAAVEALEPQAPASGAAFEPSAADRGGLSPARLAPLIERVTHLASADLSSFSGTEILRILSDELPALAAPEARREVSRKIRALERPVAINVVSPITLVASDGGR